MRVGIIGLGVGEAHIQGYQQHPRCEVVALCDLLPEKLTVAREKYAGVRTTENADEVLEDSDIDVISIASYDNYHFDQIEKAIQNGKHIFVEKPVCLYEEEALKIRSLLSERPHLKLSSNFILRMSPRFRLLKQMVRKGIFGDFFYAEGDYNYGRVHKITEGWRGQIDFYSVVYGGAVHLIDLILWLTGDRVVEVVAYGNQIATKGSGFRYNDLVVSLLKFQSGMVAKIAANFGCVFPHFHGLSLYGTKATFVNGPDAGMLYDSSDPEKKPRKIEAPYPGIPKGALLYNFVDSILNGSTAEVSTQEVFETMSVCFAIEKAARTQGPVKVEPI